MTATKIDDDIKVLLVVHPRDITDATQYAIDQFVLRGGKLLAFLDPHAYFDQKHDQMAQVMGESSGQSSLDKLFKAWGFGHGYEQGGGRPEFWHAAIKRRHHANRPDAQPQRDQ